MDGVCIRGIEVVTISFNAHCSKERTSADTIGTLSGRAFPPKENTAVVVRATTDYNRSRSFVASKFDLETGQYCSK